ncbi:MAG TPA: ribonuclease Y [Dissulfurispiraceae bacterium]|nr:ribonuclease Y [Dissulfurispiraceae bacterium]
MTSTILYILIAAVAGVLSSFAFIFVYKKNLKSQQEALEKDRVRQLEEAKREAEVIKKDAAVSVKDAVYQAKAEAEREIRERTKELNHLDKRLRQKEESLEKKIDQIEKKENDLSKKEKDFGLRERQIDEQENRNLQLIKEQMQTLENIAGMRSEEARQELFRRIEEESRFEAAKLIKRIEDETRENAEKKAIEVISFAIQRYAADHVADATVSAVSLPGDEMKGRIIGREGRNIRAFEAATGVDIIVDDTPEMVTLSAHDPVRREIARLALGKLVTDGRIHPARIEEVVEKVRKEVESTIREEGEKAVFELGISGVHPEIIKLIGRLKYRTSYGQNVLQHSKEVAFFSGMMAGELGVDTKLAKRGGLLHDIGKAVDHEMEGSHQEIGASLAKKYGESEAVINAIMAHHGDVETLWVESALVAAGDALSAARPGVRRESIELYLKRLEKLEEMAMSFSGVDKCYAIQAGREIRLIVKPELVNDDMCSLMARDLGKKIESELTYPGQIKVTVIRESRHVDYAK